MKGDNVSLKFYGQDFTPIINGLNNPNSDEKIVIEGRVEPLNKEEQLRLIIKFLDSQEKNLSKLIVENEKNKTRKKDKRELYFEYNGEFYWSGLVGIIKGTLPQISESDLQGKEVEDVKYENIVITIQIQSRFDKKNIDDKQISEVKPYFLATMLLNCKSGVNDQLVPNNSEDFFFDLLLLYLFKEKVNSCYLKGLYKTYQRFEKNDDRLKGSIDVARHIRLNMGLENGKMAYSYRENTIDNDLNRIIIYAYNKLKMKYPDLIAEVYYNTDNYNFKYFIDILKSKINLSFIDSNTLISKNLRTIAHPYYTEYEELRKISLKILRDEGVSMFNGYEEDVNGILFYIPDLWELYLEHLLKDDNYKLHSQGFNNLPVKIIDYSKDTYPDYVFSTSIDKNEQPFMILDAKFKPEWGEIISCNHAFTSNMLKDYDKCIRDMNSINAHATGVVFPTNIDSSLFLYENLEHSISDFNKIDKFYTFPIFVPYLNDYNYSKWFIEFKKKNEESIKFIKKYIFKEKDFVINNYSFLNELNKIRK